MGEQKTVNVQLNQRIDTMERTLNKRMDGFHNEIAQKIYNLQYSISRLTNQHQVQGKGKFPSQTQQNPRGVHEIANSGATTPTMDKVKAVVKKSSNQCLNRLMKLKKGKIRSRKE